MNLGEIMLHHFHTQKNNTHNINYQLLSYPKHKECVGLACARMHAL